MDKIDQLLERRVEKILPSKEALKKLLKSGKKIKLYQGFDPTGTKLHLGHTIGLRKLMDFAHAGHQVIFLFGTGTVLVGDPSERDTGRKLITPAEIDKNIKTWKKQVEPIVDFSKVKILRNDDWLTKLNLKDIIKIASQISATQLFKRESFQRRLNKGDTVWMHETLYPLLQGYDSVHMNVDLEIGGTDQEFNMLIGRELQRKMNHKEKFVLTVPMILGTNGKQMSKTSQNCIWLNDTPNNMYGKLMHIPDTLIKSYTELLTDLPVEKLDSPLANKKALAFDIVSKFHGLKAAQAAQDNFQATVQQKQVPQDIQSFNTSSLAKGANIIDLLEKAKLVKSRGQAKRLIEQGGVSLNGKKISDTNLKISGSSGVLKAGKRNWLKITN